jgi:hypothetical protein
MEAVVERSNLWTAYRRVVENKGSAGVDGVSVSEFKDWLKEHWPTVKVALLAGSYQPQAVRAVEIPKASGGARVLGIPTVVDRLIQQALLQVMQPIFDPGFSKSSFGFRPRRSAHQAVQAAQQYVRAGQRWVVDLDLEKFFDRVNHDILMSRVARGVKDKRVLRLIRRYLEAGAMHDGLTRQRTEGDATRRPAFTVAVEHFAERPGSRAGTARASVLPVRGRLQCLCAQPSGGRTRDGADNSVCGEQAAAASQSRQKCLCPALATQVPRLQHDGAEADAGEHCARESEATAVQGARAPAHRSRTATGSNN